MKTAQNHPNSVSITEVRIGGENYGSFRIVYSLSICRICATAVPHPSSSSHGKTQFEVRIQAA